MCSSANRLKHGIFYLFRYLCLSTVGWYYWLTAMCINACVTWSLLQQKGSYDNYPGGGLFLTYSTPEGYFTPLDRALQYNMDNNQHVHYVDSLLINGKYVTICPPNK